MRDASEHAWPGQPPSSLPSSASCTNAWRAEGSIGSWIRNASDVYRIMQAVPVEEFLARLRPLLADSRTEAPSGAAVGYLGELFGAPPSRGVAMAAEALPVGAPGERVQAVYSSLAKQVLDALQGAMADEFLGATSPCEGLLGGACHPRQRLHYDEWDGLPAP